MQNIASCLFVLSTFAIAGLVAEEPTGTRAPDAERIAELIRQLGDDDFATREEATRQLMDVDLSARDQVLAAQETTDPEVRERLAKILPRLDARAAQEAFLAAMKGPWQAALKEGRLAGPLLGAAGVGNEPLPMKHWPAQIPRPALPAPRDELFFGGTLFYSHWFLERIQRADGAWPSRALGARIRADVEQTALTLLAFLGAGHTEKVGKYKLHVRKAVSYLKSCQRKDGAILNENWTQVDRVAHALAVMALAEAAGMANVADTKASAQRAVDFLVRQQDSESGGFGRMTGIAADLFTTTTSVMATKSAKVAGLSVPKETFVGMIRFLDSVEDKKGKSFGYVLGGSTSAQAAIMGAVCRQFLGWKKEELREVVTVALKELGAPTVDREHSDVLVNFLATLAAFQQGGDIWKKWNEPLRKNIQEGQMQDGPTDGAWAPKGVWAGGGYILSSALNALTLEVYYRYLPMYKH